MKLIVVVLVMISYIVLSYSQQNLTDNSTTLNHTLNLNLTLNETLLNMNEEIIQEPDYVIQLTDDNFDEKIVRYEYLLLQFHSKWDGYSDKYYPELSKAASIVRNDTVPIHVGVIDWTTNRTIFNRFGEKYPRLRFIIRGEPTDFPAYATSDKLVKWLRELRDKDIKKRRDL